jgi:alanine-alpha-ketoisovalerate/valine-pyruvate aminotransferase
MKNNKFEIGDKVYAKTGITCVVDDDRLRELIDKIQGGNCTKMFYEIVAKLVNQPKVAEVIGYYKNAKGEFCYYLDSFGTNLAYKETELLTGEDLKKIIGESYDKLSKIYAEAYAKIKETW